MREFVSQCGRSRRKCPSDSFGDRTGGIASRRRRVDRDADRRRALAQRVRRRLPHPVAGSAMRFGSIGV
jgi:hypothetical protein